MKHFFLIGAIFIVACTPRSSQDHDLQVKVIQLEHEVEDLKPGLGEIMGVIQQHHAKLYYSGMNGDWALASYELGEIQEGLEDVVKFHPRFKDVKASLSQLVPAMTKESLLEVDAAIGQKNRNRFQTAFKHLSVSCSNCHAAAEHPFIKIQVPSAGMFSNQNFSK